MFLVFNKEKIYSYIIAVLTVITLFAVSELYLKDNELVETSSNIVTNVIEENNIMINNMNNSIQ